MSTLTTAVFQHLRDYVSAHCPKLRCGQVHRGNMLSIRSLDDEFVAGVGIAIGYFMAMRADSTDVSRWDLEIAIAEPDSLESVERYIQDTNNQLP